MTVGILALEGPADPLTNTLDGIPARPECGYTRFNQDRSVTIKLVRQPPRCQNVSFPNGSSVVKLDGHVLFVKYEADGSATIRINDLRIRIIVDRKPLIEFKPTSSNGIY